MAFQQSFLDEIRARVPLTQIVGRRVALKQRARDDWWGLSPFTNEKSPSFHVKDDKGFYHCFSTGEHGDHFSWLMQVEGLSFPEAVETVAGLAGMEVPKSTPEERQREERRKDLTDVVAFAVDWYSRQLHSPTGKDARDYLAGRGLEAMTIEAFQIGYAPDNRDALAEAAKEQGIDMPMLIEAGLYRKPDDGRSPYPLFRDRIMFPINDRRGRPIAFGGRFMGDAKAVGVGKYINSPDTPLFDKSRNLYNLDRAREPARQGETMLVVEGYMDVIALWQAGFPAAVAPLGTAVTEQQISELWRHVDEPVLCLDGDVAGQKAAIRAGERALPGLLPGKSLSFAFMPEGEDPDSLVQGPGGAKAMSDLVGRAQPLADFLFETESHGVRLDTPERRARLEADLFHLIAGIKDELVRREYQRSFRDMLFQLHRKHSQARIKKARGEAIRDYRNNRKPGRGGGSMGPTAEQPFGRERLMEGASKRLVRRRQEIVLAVLVNHPSLIAEYDEALDAFAFDPDLDKLRSELQKHALSGKELDPEALTHHLIAGGAEAPLSAVLGRDVLMLAPQAKPTAPLAEARQLLDHLLLIRQQHALIGEYRLAGRTGTSAGDAGDDRLKALRRSMDDGEGQLGADLSDYGD
ncbi:DNA primase [Rhodospirillaceae bacterium KN72]|uniref:DNA primase n=1 Tax=Pacificispira spongiicola TaxID=2729598 RepID=A0A7Y0HED0_9PROT|nr:DNA primase [Pacificispira spongiicola]NMM43433.1 DNA primase [Pacificispira spongiicola]